MKQSTNTGINCNSDKFFHNLEHQKKTDIILLFELKSQISFAFCVFGKLKTQMSLAVCLRSECVLGSDINNDLVIFLFFFSVWLSTSSNKCRIPNRRRDPELTPTVFIANSALSTRRILVCLRGVLNCKSTSKPVNLEVDNQPTTHVHGTGQLMKCEFSGSRTCM